MLEMGLYKAWSDLVGQGMSSYLVRVCEYS